LFVCFPGVTTHFGYTFHSPVAGFSLLVFEVSWSHTTTRHIRWDSSGRVINPSQRPLPDNTQHSQQTNIHAPGGIRTHDLSRWAAEDLRLRPHGHCDRQLKLTTLRFWSVSTDKNIKNWLSGLGGSTSKTGCLRTYPDMTEFPYFVTETYSWFKSEHFKCILCLCRG
jgi:hypothetical protein